MAKRKTTAFQKRVRDRLTRGKSSVAKRLRARRGMAKRRDEKEQAQERKKYDRQTAAIRKRVKQSGENAKRRQATLAESHRELKARDQYKDAKTKVLRQRKGYKGLKHGDVAFWLVDHVVIPKRPYLESSDPETHDAIVGGVHEYLIGRQ